MKKMKENPEEHKNVRQNVMEGYLFIQEKRRRRSSDTGGLLMFELTFDLLTSRLLRVLLGQVLLHLPAGAPKGHYGDL